jgi:phosphoglycolate phosphatase
MHASPAKSPTRAIFWDIDGTLLVTGRAGMIGWERAFAAVSGGAPFPAVRPDGLTDYQIAAWLLGHGGAPAEPDDEVQAAAARLVSRYEEALADALPLRQGRVLDQVRPILDWLGHGRADVLSWLVTGNTRAGGAAKLRHYGLASYFAPAAADGDPGLAGAFAIRVEPRARIVRRALEQAQAVVPGLRPSEVLVIGDTPHDIEGAHAIGVPVLAVATNTHSIDELSALAPWQVRSVLPSPDEFAVLLRG